MIECDILVTLRLVWQTFKIGLLSNKASILLYRGTFFDVVIYTVQSVYSEMQWDRQKVRIRQSSDYKKFYV